ncbi:hypothetical protein [Actinomadura alba]|uniref:Uncharacterized protein n=1 Tax=Actinomadura alba TaxID=406431 RepID=A0ABR7LQJ5_9ACTN|nr:hypothetical protein [Actinomadura alba]MBC6467025.1 hypothetical protein [Actinomadura alba]
MANTVILTVPEKLLAMYVVAAPERMPCGLTERSGGRATTALCRGEGTLVDVAPRVDVIASGEPWFAHMVELLGCSDCGPHLAPAALARLCSAERHLLVTATHGPAWPPLHVYTAATTAEALAVSTGGILLDPESPLLRRIRWAPCALRHRDGFGVADWLEVAVSADETDIRRGMRMTTGGLARFGLPELLADRIPPDLAGGWCDVLNGLAQTLLEAHWADLDAEPGRAFREIAEVVTVTSEDDRSRGPAWGGGRDPVTPRSRGARSGVLPHGRAAARLQRAARALAPRGRRLPARRLTRGRS